jgi:hypothetical protein
LCSSGSFWCPKLPKVRRPISSPHFRCGPFKRDLHSQAVNDAMSYTLHRYPLFFFLEPPSRFARTKELHRYQFYLHFERCNDQLMYMHKHQIYMLSKSVSVINQKWLFQCSLAYSSNQGRIQHRSGVGSSPCYRYSDHEAPPTNLHQSKLGRRG